MSLDEIVATSNRVTRAGEGERATVQMAAYAIALLMVIRTPNAPPKTAEMRLIEPLLEKLIAELVTVEASTLIPPTPAGRM